MLNESEQALLRDTERAALVGLDEDELIARHDRVRRARNKYSKLYRRRASGQVRSDAGRGRAHAAHARTATKAEAFEDALARVSRQLAKVASARASELKAERLATAQWATKASPAKAKRARARQAPSTTKARKQLRTPARKRASAQARAATRRNQAARATR
jgi:hypothetical protein